MKSVGVSELAAGDAKMILAENMDRAFADGAFGCRGSLVKMIAVRGRGSGRWLGQTIVAEHVVWLELKTHAPGAV